MTEPLRRLKDILTGLVPGLRPPQAHLGFDHGRPLVLTPGHQCAMISMGPRSGKTELALRAARMWPGPVLLVMEDPSHDAAWEGDSSGYHLPRSMVRFSLRELPLTSPTALTNWFEHDAPIYLSAGRKFVLDASWSQYLQTELSQGLQTLLLELAHMGGTGRPALVLIDGLYHNLPAIDFAAIRKAATLVPNLTLMGLSRVAGLNDVYDWVDHLEWADSVLLDGTGAAALLGHAGPTRLNHLADIVQTADQRPSAVYLSAAGPRTLKKRGWRHLDAYTPAPSTRP